MNVAARFPIKANRPLIWLVYLCHIFVFIGGYSLINSLFSVFFILVACIISVFYAHKQYVRLTQSPDDLCWSGENWLMHEDNEQRDIQYLDLLSTSWVTAQFCLLKFESNNQSKAWFFSRKLLGERLFRELCYLVRLEMKHPKGADLDD